MPGRQRKGCPLTDKKKKDRKRKQDDIKKQHITHRITSK